MSVSEASVRPLPDFSTCSAGANDAGTSPGDANLAWRPCHVATAFASEVVRTPMLRCDSVAKKLWFRNSWWIPSMTILDPYDSWLLRVIDDLIINWLLINCTIVHDMVSHTIIDSRLIITGYMTNNWHQLTISIKHGEMQSARALVCSDPIPTMRLLLNPSQWVAATIVFVSNRWYLIISANYERY